MTENNEVVVNGQNNSNMKNKIGNNAIKTLDASILDKVIIYTGNVMKQANINSFDSRRNNQELISALTDTLKAHLYTKSMWSFDKTNGVLEIPDPFYSNQKLTEDRADYEITAKLFYLPSSSTSQSPPPQYITQSIYHLFKLLGIDTIDTFIIYFNGLRFDDSSRNDTNDEMNKTDLIKAWKELEKLYVNNRIHRLGVSEFTKNRLENFLKVVEVPPKIDQVNIADCNNNIKEILEFAKKNDIELLTHRDPAVILPSKTFQKIIEETNAYKVSLNNELSPRWVLKYSVMIKCRGVVANKGYIIMGSSPNSDSNFTYTIDPIVEKDV